MLACGRYAVLEDGMGFSLVPWKPVIEQRLGQQLAACVRSDGDGLGHRLGSRAIYYLTAYRYSKFIL
jgi:hypothetical protein